MSGLSRTPGKRVQGNTLTGVRIPPSPPANFHNLTVVFVLKAYLFSIHHCCNYFLPQAIFQRVSLMDFGKSKLHLPASVLPYNILPSPIFPEYQ